MAKDRAIALWAAIRIPQDVSGAPCTCAPWWPWPKALNTLSIQLGKASITLPGLVQGKISSTHTHTRAMSFQSQGQWKVNGRERASPTKANRKNGAVSAGSVLRWRKTCLGHLWNEPAPVPGVTNPVWPNGPCLDLGGWQMWLLS